MWDIDGTRTKFIQHMAPWNVAKRLLYPIPRRSSESEQQPSLEGAFPPNHPSTSHGHTVRHSCSTAPTERLPSSDLVVVVPRTPTRSLVSVTVEDEARVGASEAEGVGHDALGLHVDALGQDVHPLCLLDEVLDVRRLGEEAAIHHDEGVDSLVGRRQRQERGRRAT